MTLLRSAIWQSALAETESLVTTHHKPSLAVRIVTNQLTIIDFMPSLAVMDSQG